MGYKVGIYKQQGILLPNCLDDYVPEDHICRIISAFSEQLDMDALGYKYASCKSTGCRPYDPRMMLNLYIYGYLHRVRSSRRLMGETTRNIEVMWLMNGLKPDDKTICNFRKDNTQALRETFKVFARMCQKLNLYGGKLIATDGTKFRANNSRKNNYSKAKVEQDLTRIDKQISEYMNALEQGDTEEENDKAPDTGAIKAALEKLRQRKVKVEELCAQLATESEISTVDPDSRLMRSGGDARTLDVCYNVQTTVDDKHHMIVDFDIADSASDRGNLLNMTERAKEVLEVGTFTCLADKGYYDGADIAACERNGITLMVAKQKPGGAKMNKGFTHRDFTYDRENDCYICPCQNQMYYKCNKQHSDGREYRIYANYTACGQCPKKSVCMKSQYRHIYRLLYQDTLDIVDERTRKNKSLYQKRQTIVEHPFGTIKAVWGYKQFLCRTKPKIAAETALACLAYNLRRFITISRENGMNPAEALT